MPLIPGALSLRPGRSTARPERRGRSARLNTRFGVCLVQPDDDAAVILYVSLLAHTGDDVFGHDHFGAVRQRFGEDIVDIFYLDRVDGTGHLWAGVHQPAVDAGRARRDGLPHSRSAPVR